MLKSLPGKMIYVSLFHGKHYSVLWENYDPSWVNSILSELGCLELCEAASWSANKNYEQAVLSGWCPGDLVMPIHLQSQTQAVTKRLHAQSGRVIPDIQGLS